VPTTRSTLFTVNKDEWDTKENVGKSIHYVYSGRAKGTSWVKVLLNRKKTSF